MREAEIHFQSDVDLCAKFLRPQTAKGLVVFSHPHTLYGGDMDNNVVRLCCHQLNKHGFATFRFDFRGAGKSGGSYDNGRGEVKDLLAAIKKAREEMPNLPLILAGYSFGSWITWMALPQIADIVCVSIISPPFDLDDKMTYQSYKTTQFPVFAHVGTQDQFCSEKSFNEQIQQLTPQMNWTTWGNIDHMWIGFENELADKLAKEWNLILK